MTTTDIIRAMRNIQLEGDTDVFPNTMASRRFLRNRKENIRKVREMETDLLVLSTKEFRVKYAVKTVYAQVYKNSGGLREVSQLNPYINLCFLSLAIEIARQTERLRVSVAENRVHSYRFLHTDFFGRLFELKINHLSYRDAIKLGLQYSETVVCTDLKCFYPSISVEVLTDSLRQLGVDSMTIRKMEKLIQAIGTKGLPVGGNASRILAELVLHRVDRYLQEKKIHFYRFVDDFTIILDSNRDDYAFLVDFENFLSQLGVGLNKKKTLVFKGFGANADIPVFQLKNTLYQKCDYTVDFVDSRRIVKGLKNLDKFIELLNRNMLKLSLLDSCEEAKVSIAIQAICNRWQFLPIHFPKIAKWILRQDCLNCDTKKMISERAFSLFFFSNSVIKSSINQLYILELMNLNMDINWRKIHFEKLSKMELPEAVSIHLNTINIYESLEQTS